MKKIILAFLVNPLLKIYQYAISPLLGTTCRFEPTCSCYAKEAFEKHSLFYAGWLTLRRLLRCHPWGCSGYDPVPPHKEN